MFFLHCSKDNKLIYFHLQYVVFVPVTGGGLTDAIPRILHPGCASRKDWADKRVFTDVETVKSQFSAVPPSNEQMQKLLRLLHEVLLSCKKSDEASSVRFVKLNSHKLTLS